MTAPFPTHKQEEWRYADLDALKPVWEQFAEPVTLTVGAGESFEEVWLPTADDVHLRRVQLALGEGATARIFALNTAPLYGRIELEVSLEQGAEFELYAANIGTGLSTNEIVTNVKHIGVGGTWRFDPYAGWNVLFIIPRSQVLDPTPNVDSLQPGQVLRCASSARLLAASSSSSTRPCSSSSLS